ASGQPDQAPAAVAHDLEELGLAMTKVRDDQGLLYGPARVGGTRVQQDPLSRRRALGSDPHGTLLLAPTIECRGQRVQCILWRVATPGDHGPDEDGSGARGGRGARLRRLARLRDRAGRLVGASLGTVLAARRAHAPTGAREPDRRRGLALRLPRPLAG